MTAYFIFDEDGDVIRNKDGWDFIDLDGLNPWNFTDYAYDSQQSAERERDFYDPEGNLQVKSLEIDFEVR